MTTTTTTPKHGIEALDAIRAIKDAMDEYSKITGRWALKDMQVHEDITDHDEELMVGPDEAFLALINSTEVEVPSPYGDGNWADANYETFRDEMQDAMSALGVRWALCDECSDVLAPDTASPESSKFCKACVKDKDA